MNQPPLILVVDDEANFREIFSTKLTVAGFSVVTAQNGAEGIQKARETRPDLILMDVKMPVMSGTEATLKIKEDPLIKDTRVVFLTAFGDPRTEMEGVDLKFSKEIGAFSYIKKTDDYDKIVTQIKSYLA